MGVPPGLKQWAIQCLIELSNRYESFFGTLQTGAQNCSCNEIDKIFGARQRRDSSWVSTVRASLNLRLLNYMPNFLKKQRDFCCNWKRTILSEWWWRDDAPFWPQHTNLKNFAPGILLFLCSSTKFLFELGKSHVASRTRNFCLKSFDCISLWSQAVLTTAGAFMSAMLRVFLGLRIEVTNNRRFSAGCMSYLLCPRQHNYTAFTGLK